MMREIKFKVWEPKTKQMTMLHPEDVSEALSNHLRGEDVLLQFTSLYDNNRREVYEGDLIEIHRQPWCEQNNFEVYWSESGFYRAKSTDGLMDVPLFDLGSEEFAVVGNIYENPTILKP
jgi:YopX protein